MSLKDGLTFEEAKARQERLNHISDRKEDILPKIYDSDYEQFKKLCTEFGIVCPSYKWFCENKIEVD